MRRLLIASLLLFILAACGAESDAPDSANRSTPDEIAVQALDLTTDIGAISSLAWHDDQLMILPRTGDVIHPIDRATLTDAIDNGTPLTPPTLPIAVRGDWEITDIKGYESLIFVGDDAYLTLVAGADDNLMTYLVSATLRPVDGFIVDPTSAMPIPHPENATDGMYSALLNHGGILVALYSRNNTAQLLPIGIPVSEAFGFPLLPYRVTDATDAENGLFWAINQGESATDSDPLAQYGNGETHQAQAHTERLVQLRIGDEGVELTETAPIYLQLGDSLRQWAGIARLDNRGFIVASDNMLGFVPVE